MKDKDQLKVEILGFQLLTKLNTIGVTNSEIQYRIYELELENKIEYYFKKKPAELSVVESAFLAMVLPNPIKYSKSFYRKELTPFARKRLHHIIEDLYRYKRISEDEYLLGADELASFLQPAAPAPTGDSLENSPESEFLENEDSSEDDSLF